MITCPICGLQMNRFAHNHFDRHGLTGPQFHALRIEKEFGRPIAEFLNDIYIKQALSSPEIFRRYGLTFRTLRSLLTANNIPLRTMSEAIAVSWGKDDGSRAVATGLKMSETAKRFDFGGQNNPAKRPDIARKISAAKRENNPGLMPMLLGNRDLRLANPSPLESAMHAALDAAGIVYEREYQVGRYFIDIALPNAMVAIECDGRGWHDTKIEYDVRRDAFLREQGWHVFHFTQVQIQVSVEWCVQDLIAKLNELGIDPAATK